MRTRQRARLNRQFDLLEARVPAVRGFLRWVRKPSLWFVRVPIGFLLVLGGIFSILPVLGLWMLPLGLLLLALDLPFLQAPVNWAIIVLRRKWDLWQRNRKKARAGAR